MRGGAAGAADEAIAAERGRLVRLCARLTGDRHAAEDLAQEALLEAWRNAEKLRDPDKRPQWLAGIARNLCRNWVRSRGRELPRLVRPDHGEGAADAFDVELDLERDELARLLDRALGLLPPATREILVARYVRESPHAEIAERMGVSEDAVSMRLTRGRLLLRRAITTGLRDEAEVYGLYDAASDEWRETRVWCPRCGQRKLVARIPRPPGAVSFRCPACKRTPDTVGSEYRLANPHFARLIGGLTSPRSILNRTAAWVHDYFTRGLEERVVACTNYGRPTPLHMYLPEGAPATVAWSRGVYAVCAACGEQVSSSAGGLVASLPEVQRFRREHPRVRTLPELGVESGGRSAVVTGFESVAGGGRLDVVTLRETFEVVAVHGALEPRRER